MVEGLISYHFIFLQNQVNVMDGLKMYEELFDDAEVSKLLSLSNDLRASGKRGQFQGKFLFILTQLDYLCFLKKIDYDF